MRTSNLRDIETLTYQEALALEELISKVNSAFRVKNVILFGSKARGDSTGKSDVDIMVIIEEDETADKRNKLSEISFEVNYKYDTNIYAGLGYSSKWDDKEYLALPLPSNIRREGVELRV